MPSPQRVKKRLCVAEDIETPPRTHIITQEAVNFLTNCAWNKNNDLYLSTKFLRLWDTISPRLENFCVSIIHPETGEVISKYEKLMWDPKLQHMWTTVMGKEFGSLAQGDDKTGTEGTNYIFVLTHEQIKNIPKDRAITYTKIVVNFQPQTEDPNWVRLTAGGNLIKYPGELTTRTADIKHSKDSVEYGVQHTRCKIYDQGY